VGEVGDWGFDAAFMIVQSSPQCFLKYFGTDLPLGYNNPVAVKLIEDAMATADTNEKDRIYSALSRIFQEEQPITYLLPTTRTFFVHIRVQGLSTPFRADPLKIMENVWLEKEMP
jgi:ABC-type transport system substrate-binding protein